MKKWDDHNLPQLKEELRKAGLPVSGRKNELVARITKHYNDLEFFLFPQLPIELRDMVWEAAFPKRRLLKARRFKRGRMVVDYLQDLRQLLHTCKESRSFALRMFQHISFRPTFLLPEAKSSTILFNQERDMIYLGNWTGRASVYAMSNSTEMDCGWFKQVAWQHMDLSLTSDFDWGNVLDLLAKLQGVRELFIVDDYAWRARRLSDTRIHLNFGSIKQKIEEKRESFISFLSGSSYDYMSLRGLRYSLMNA